MDDILYSPHVQAVGTVGKIDSYFQKYQMGHCQANPVMPHHTPPPGSTIPIVRTDAQDSGIEDLADNMPHSRFQPHQYKAVLTEQELMIYKHALLCAQFPVLGSKLPGSSLPSPTQGRGASLLASPPPSPSLSLEDGGDEGDLMVQEETLCVLVKEAFQLSEERHLFYDEHITKGLGNKPPAKLLVEELMGRLSLLQTNSYPFYVPQAFETRNAYDLWQQQEGQRISALINKFWRGALPNLDPAVCKASYWSNMHDMYRDLMVLLLKHDKVLKAGASTGCPLLSSSRRLLREFGLHYGVGEVYRRVVYVAHLSEKENFEGDDWFLRHMSQTVVGIQDLLIKHQARVTMIRNEFDMLCRALTQLKDRCCEQMQKLLQERIPQNRVVCLITLLSDILELNTTLFGRLPDDLQTIMTECLKESVKNCYHGHKLRLTTELRLNAYSMPVSAELISKLIVHIQSEIQYCQENYQQLFQLYHVVIMDSAVETLYKCLMADVSVLCDKTQSQRNEEQRREYIDPEMVAMARRLDRLDQDWKDFIPVTSQLWRKSITKSAIKWFQLLIRDVQAMVVYSIMRDEFQAVHLKFSDEDDQTPIHWNGQHRPSNASPLTQSVGSAFASVVPREPSVSESITNNNNTTIPPKRPQHIRRTSSHNSGHSGVLNFKKPLRTRSFPEIDELIDHGGRWSAVHESRLDHQEDEARTFNKTLVATGTSAFQPVSFTAGTASAETHGAQSDLHQSQSFPELSAAIRAAVPSRMIPKAPLNDENVFEEDHFSESTIHSHRNSDRRRSDRTNSSDMENSSGELSDRDGMLTQRRSDQSQTLRAAFGELGIFSSGGIRQLDVVLPISSSVVDMVYVVRHACKLMQDICGVLKPEMMSETDAGDDDQSSRGQITTDLMQLLLSPLQAITFAIRLYGSNMLAIDLCATPGGEANKILTKELLNRVMIAQNSGMLGACRHERRDLPDCDMYFNRNEACLCDNFEPITPQMCLRINNIHGLLELLPDLIPVAGGITNQRAQALEEMAMRHDNEYGPLQRFLEDLLLGQVKLLAYKVNLMLSQALRVLLSLDVGNYSIADRLHPLTACMHNHLVATETWLYPQCFQYFCLELWRYIVKDFDEMVHELQELHVGHRNQAMLLLQALAHLMELMNNHEEHGLNADMFLEPADSIIQILQLYTWPTSRLVELYQGLLQRAWDGTSEGSWPVPPKTLKTLQRHLCKQRKCFSGEELLHALIRCHKQDEESSQDVGWEWAHQLAERLVRCGLVRRMTAKGHTVDVTLLGSHDGPHPNHSDNGDVSDFENYSFPKVTLHSIPTTSKNIMGTDTSTLEDTEGASDDAKRDETGGSGRRRNTSSESDSDDDAERANVRCTIEVPVEVHATVPFDSPPEHHDEHLGTVSAESVTPAEDGITDSSDKPSTTDSIVEEEEPTSCTPATHEKGSCHASTEGALSDKQVDVGKMQDVIREESESMPIISEDTSTQKRKENVSEDDRTPAVDEALDDGLERSVADAGDRLPPEGACSGETSAEHQTEIKDGQNDVIHDVDQDDTSIVPDTPVHALQETTRQEINQDSNGSLQKPETGPETVSATDGNESLRRDADDEKVFQSSADIPSEADELSQNVSDLVPDAMQVEQKAVKDESSTSLEAQHVSSEQSLLLPTEDEGSLQDAPETASDVVESNHHHEISGGVHEGVSSSGTIESIKEHQEQCIAGSESRAESVTSVAVAVKDKSSDSDEIVHRGSENSVQETVASDNNVVSDTNQNAGILDNDKCSSTDPVPTQGASEELQNRLHGPSHRSSSESLRRSEIQPSPFSDSSASDTSDYECIATPRSRTPNQHRSFRRPSHGPAAFTTDLQQLYCFSQVYDPIAKESTKSKLTKSFERAINQLETSCSPELVVSIIGTRHDASAKDFINQLGDEALAVKEASCMKKACKECFGL